MAYARHSQLRVPKGRTILDWFTGTGFLVADAGAFFVSLMVLLPWNLYRSPGDLWVAQPLRSWAFILTFHALVVGAIALARGIVRSPEPETAMPVRQPGLSARTSTSWSPARSDAATRETASSLIAAEWARRWLEEDRIDEGAVPETSPRAPHTLTSPLPGNSITPWPEAPEERPHPVDAEAILADWLDEQASEIVAASGPRVDPLRSAAGVQQQPTEDEVEIDSELEWKWVEAAASAWLSKRGSEQNGYHPDSSSNA
jgi:hypothetical protein